MIVTIEWGMFYCITITLNFKRICIYIARKRSTKVRKVEEGNQKDDKKQQWNQHKTWRFSAVCHKMLQLITGQKESQIQLNKSIAVGEKNT